MIEIAKFVEFLPYLLLTLVGITAGWLKAKANLRRRLLVDTGQDAEDGSKEVELTERSRLESRLQEKLAAKDALIPLTLVGACPHRQDSAAEDNLRSVELAESCSLHGRLQQKSAGEDALIPLTLLGACPHQQDSAAEDSQKCLEFVESHLLQQDSAAEDSQKCLEFVESHLLQQDSAAEDGQKSLEFVESHLLQQDSAAEDVSKMVQQRISSLQEKLELAEEQKEALTKKNGALDEQLFRETACFEAEKEELTEALEAAIQTARKTLEEKVLSYQQYEEAVAVLARNAELFTAREEELQLELRRAKTDLKRLMDQVERQTNVSVKEREISDVSGKEDGDIFDTEDKQLLKEKLELLEEKDELRRALVQLEEQSGEMKKEMEATKKRLLILERDMEELNAVCERQEEYIDALLRESVLKQLEINKLKNLQLDAKDD